MVIKITEMLLENGLKPAILSRGYKRSSERIHLINGNLSVTETGDEPMLLFQHFGNVPVVLSGNRVKGAEYILQHVKEANVIVMDDGFQHRWIKPTMSILLTTFQHPFTTDHLLPAGYLREPAGAAHRAQLIVVTKTPLHTSKESKQELINEIKKYSTAPVLFSSLTFQTLKHVNTGNFFDEPLSSYHCLTVSGISNDETFIENIRNQALETECLSFSNHHAYTRDDAGRIASRFNNIAADKKIIITTGKDAVKLKSFEELKRLPVYLLPVEHDFLPDDTEILKTELIKHARKN